jgi:hypothetical protein
MSNEFLRPHDVRRDLGHDIDLTIVPRPGEAIVVQQVLDARVPQLM